jgi:hypothetical protein
MVHRKAKPQGTLLKEFNEHVTEARNPAMFIDQILLPMARGYEEILDASYESTAYAEEVNENLRWLDRLEFADWVPPALSFMVRSRQQPEAMRNYFRDLERLAFGMLIARAGINERIERFSRLTLAVEAGSDLWAPDSALQLTSGEQYLVYSTLDGPVYETLSARARSAVLLRLDALLSGGGATYEYDVVTVEHVLPQNPGQNSTWVKWFPAQKDRLTWVHRLGNLALLTRRKNSAASNYEFDTKKQSYFSRNGISPFVLTTQVLDKTEWTLGVIEKRQKTLLTRFEQHWRLQGRKSPLDELDEL